HRTVTNASQNETRSKRYRFHLRGKFRVEADAGPRSHADFGALVEAALDGLSPAEQRIARFFAERKDVVLLASAAEIAERAGASDATVVRTAQALGFESLLALREVLLSELIGSPSPGPRLKRTLDEAGRSAAGILRHVLGVHEEGLDILKREDFAAASALALAILATVRRRPGLAVQPSGALGP